MSLRKGGVNTPCPTLLATVIQPPCSHEISHLRLGSRIGLGVKYVFGVRVKLAEDNLYEKEKPPCGGFSEVRGPGLSNSSR